MDDFLLRALTAGMIVAILCGSLGVFILWRRMAYFGDTVSHASILGVSLGILMGVSVSFGVIATSIAVALAMLLLRRDQRFSNDTVLGVLAHSALSLGLVLMVFVEGQQIDLNAWLFGDILAVTKIDLMILASVGSILLIVLRLIWKPLLSMSVSEDLARVEGVNIAGIGLTYTLLVAITIAVGIKVIGALLISSMLIIPAAAARNLAKSPEAMVLYSMLIGVIAVVSGLSSSYFWDTPAGPSIVVAATCVFIVLQMLPKR
ncbi:MAG: Zinc ABC transporter, inner membrane permease protein ZnuB [uncultured Thiotrichaceae bacterium]|uniref:High-affinity zinc uptake system membrane protein ZnuB n=1 Tax=uncultured Thiotrichaceae bacterium TaxID=298394 RepID=A0A6S6TB65_9GAMM|nr:MAG: Zinc ABC transporter, inner membrane permease protein ZnuB [uncultured Thiotrichaceae bacterium]